MEVAVLTDVHGNLQALESALADVDGRAVDAIYCGGDLVGYGARPNEVCALVESRGIPTIYGNYDHAIARDVDDCGCSYPTPRDREIGERSVAWTLEHTGAEAKAFMRDLPFDLRFELGGTRVRLVHGSPRKVNEYLLEDREPRTFERIAAQADCDVLVFGHTHKPWIHEYGGVLFVNCGSVGKPKDGDPRGGYALLTETDGAVHATIERFEYDVAGAAAEVRASALPDELAGALERGG